MSFQYFTDKNGNCNDLCKMFTIYLGLRENGMEYWAHKIADVLWGWHMICLFLMVGLLYTIRLRGIQFRRLPEALRSVRTGSDGKGLSSYSVLCTSLAATIGTGNIVGVATAIGTGGPGALFWMLVAACLAMATQFAEGYLAVQYRPKSAGAIAGPFAYMERGVGKPWLAKLYAGITVGAGVLGVGTVTQVNSIAKGVRSLIPCGMSLGAIHRVEAVTGLVVMLGAGAVLLGGAKRIVKVCETLVPLMSALYLFCSVTILVRCWERVPYGIGLICSSAFRPRAVLGAGAGIGIRQVMRMGIGRGVFTNEAGMGTGAITAGASDEKDPVKQGLITMSTTFIDTILICTLSGLCLIVTGAWDQPLEGGEMTALAWAQGLPWSRELSSYLLVLCLVFFAFATIIGWSFYGEWALTYLTGGKWVRVYRMGYLLAVGIGPFLSVATVFDMADILNAAMALPNLGALLFLHRTVAEKKKQLKF